MSKRKRKGFVKVARRPEVRVTSKGARFSPGSLRVGGKVGVTVGKRGLSLNIKTKRGTISSNRGLLISTAALFLRRKRKPKGKRRRSGAPTKRGGTW